VTLLLPKGIVGALRALRQRATPAGSAATEPAKERHA